jgi:hypothetical protein
VELAGDSWEMGEDRCRIRQEVKRKGLSLRWVPTQWSSLVDDFRTLQRSFDWAIGLPMFLPPFGVKDGAGAPVEDGTRAERGYSGA